MRVALEKSEQEPNQSVVPRVWLAVQGGRQSAQLLAHATASQVLDSEVPLDGHSSVAGPEVETIVLQAGCLIPLGHWAAYWCSEHNLDRSGKWPWGQRLEPGKII